jgi:HemY protein
LDSAFAVDTIFDLHTRRAEWPEAQAILFDAVRRRVKTEVEAVGARTTIFTARAIQAEGAGRFHEADEFALKALSSTADFVPAAVLSARILERDGKARQATRLLEELWRRNPHPELIIAYLCLWPLETPLERVKRVQHLTSANPSVAESRVAVAAAALDAKLWGAARLHLTALDDGEINVRVCRLMARLEQEVHGDCSAAREWLERANSAPVDRTWTCKSCGAIAPEWSALCGNCSAFDTITWKQPPRVSFLSLLPAKGAVLTKDDGEGQGESDDPGVESGERPSSPRERHPS